MQLLDVPTHRSLNQPDLLTVLEDIVHNVSIEPDFRITHPNYKPFELPQETSDRFQALPSELQAKYLSLQLRSFLYGIYYNGSMRSSLALDGENSASVTPLNLENNSMMGVNLQFYEQLHHSNQGTGYFDSGWLVVREETDGSLAVKKGDLTLHLDRDRHLKPEEHAAIPGDIVAVKMPKNFVQNGFYMAVSNQGHSTRHSIDRDQTTVRVYFNLAPEGALAVMTDLTEQLNATAIPFTFKALYNPDNYDRHDSAVLYFSKSDFESVFPVLRTLYRQNQTYFRAEVPLFTKLVTPGLAIAEEPNQKFATQESFGMNRCQIVANGLLLAHYQRDFTPSTRLNAVLQQFNSLGLTLQHPYLNANSENIYFQF